MQKLSLWAAGMALLVAAFPCRSYGEEATGIRLSQLTQKREAAYQEYIIEAGQRHEVDPPLIKAIIMAESGFNPRAVSHQGAKGLMQLMPGTAKDLGVKNVFDPERNIHGGVKYFRFLLDEFDGQAPLALAAYNAGLYQVKKYEGIPPFKATRRYVRKVMKYYRYYLQQQEMASGPNRA